jgi:hypothetical protein
VVAPAGTGTVICPAFQAVAVDGVPLNLTVLEPWLLPKFVPVMVIEIPTAPNMFDTLVIVGVGFTVKVVVLLDKPPTVTRTPPVVAPTGTGALI